LKVKHSTGTEKRVKEFVRKPKGKKPLERPRHKWEDNIKWIGWEGVDWIHVLQDRNL
jgi:hypothetical protein